uniref:Protein N-terminal glutamine amidohydrolase n=1 Tax=Trypanosoma congolense (strain IL3000) TaxID=1068625 RepID=G0UWK3_TRYCI|nr:conserved hypothetical protein [Trypanosoma congolense IL3000]
MEENAPAGSLPCAPRNVRALQLPAREDVPYASHYCEENTYKVIELLYQSCALGDGAVFAVFISNNIKSTPVWRQRLRNGEGPVLWDYHVVALADLPSGVEGGSSSKWVFDYDTVLPYPCEAVRYINESFHPYEQLADKYRQWFRVIPGREYLECFASDRSHMKEATVPRPSWSPIRGRRAKGDMLLDLYIDVRPRAVEDVAEDDRWLGTVMDIKKFTQFVCA